MKSVIQNFMSELFSEYQEVSKSGKYLDIIILSVFDECQKLNYQKQLKEMLETNEYKFLKNKIHVISDPPNSKIGSGGATLHSLNILKEIYGDSLYLKKILMIHSGGYSKRLPSYSTQGKLFVPMPIKELSESKDCCMLDVKLAMYLRFCFSLPAGIFVTCSDDVETFYLPDDPFVDSSFEDADVVCLAHPCDLKTASHHGVYVIEKNAKQKDVFVTNCLEVLQKPSIELMKERDAVCKNDNGDEMVYSDSAFWLSPNCYKRLMTWYEKNKISGELDAYRDILTCFGSNTNRNLRNQFMVPKKSFKNGSKNIESTLVESRVENESNLVEFSSLSEKFLDRTVCVENKSEFYDKNRSKVNLIESRKDNNNKNELPKIEEFKRPKKLENLKRKSWADEDSDSKHGLLDECKSISSVLKDMIFKVIVLNKSKFYHFGTMREYLENFTGDPFRSEINIVNNTSVFGEIINSADTKESENTELDSGSEFFPLQSNSRDNLLIKSIISDRSYIKTNKNSKCIIEYSSVESPITIAGDLILSNVSIGEVSNLQKESIKFDSLDKNKKGKKISNLDAPIERRISEESNQSFLFEGNFLYHTSPIKISETVFYVTVAFGIDSDLKKPCSQLKNLKIYNVDLETIVYRLFLNQDDNVCSNGPPYCLWNLKLFQCSKNRQESFSKTFNFVKKIQNLKKSIAGVESDKMTSPADTVTTLGDKITNFTEEETNSADKMKKLADKIKDKMLFSMKELVEFKDLDSFLNDRKILLQKLGKYTIHPN